MQSELAHILIRLWLPVTPIRLVSARFVMIMLLAMTSVLWTSTTIAADEPTPTDTPAEESQEASPGDEEASPGTEEPSDTEETSPESETAAPDAASKGISSSQIPFSDRSAERFGYISTSAVKQAELQKLEHPLTQVLDLETSFGSSIALYQPAVSPEPRGTVILIPDINTHADWPGELNPLRLGLADDGWHTIALLIPDVPLKVILAPTDEPSTDQEKAPTNYEQLTQALISAGMMQATNYKGDALVILGVGNGATWAAKIASDLAQQEALAAQQVAAQQQAATENLLPGVEPPPTIEDAKANTVLVMVDGRFGKDTEVTTVPSIEALLPLLTIPVIDIYRSEGFGKDNLLSQPSLRKRIATTSGLSHYYQRKVRGSASDWRINSQWLVKNVRGALRTFALPLLSTGSESKSKETERQLKPGV